MNGFISHIIQHHLQAENTIQPRLPGRFESFNAAQKQDETDMVESDEVNVAPNQKINNPTKDLNEKPISKNQNLPVDSGNPTDEIKPKNDLFPKPEFDAIETQESKPFEVYTPVQAAGRSRTDRNIDSGEKVRGDLITNINSNIFVRENTEKSTRNEDVFNGHITANKSSFVFPENKHSGPNQNSVFFEKANQTAPTIKVSIGRIEVRAIVTPQEVKKETNTTKKPEMTLEDYLNKRNDKK